MLPHDPTGKSGPKKPLPDHVSVMYAILAGRAGTLFHLHYIYLFIYIYVALFSLPCTALARRHED